MKIKVSKCKFNIHYRGSPRGSRTQQHAYCLRYAHSQHIESHLGKKQQQAKIPIAFLFSQLHFNNVTSHALFYGGHLVMRSKRCAVQNQWITLIAVQILQTSRRLKFSTAIMTSHNSNPTSRLGSLHYTDLASWGHHQLYSEECSAWTGLFWKAKNWFLSRYCYMTISEPECKEWTWLSR